MTEHRREDLTIEERQWLDALPPEVPPPGHVRDRVLRALRAAGLVHAVARRRWRVSFAVAAAALIALTAFTAGRLTVSGEGEPAGPRFLLLLYEGPTFDPGGHTEADLVAEYRGWAERLAADGYLVSAEKLSPGAHVVAGPGAGHAVSEAAGYRPPGDLGGFFLIAAPDSLRAREIARASPHVRHGGVVVVRRVEET